MESTVYAPKGFSGKQMKGYYLKGRREMAIIKLNLQD